MPNVLTYDQECLEEPASFLDNVCTEIITEKS